MSKVYLNAPLLHSTIVAWVMGILLLGGCIRSLSSGKNYTLIGEKETATCSSDSDCVPASCCHPTSAVNKKYAPDCIGIACTMVCDGPLDCGAGKVACIENTCVIILSKKSNK